MRPPPPVPGWPPDGWIKASAQHRSLARHCRGNWEDWDTTEANQPRIHRKVAPPRGRCGGSPTPAVHFARFANMRTCDSEHLNGRMVPGTLQYINARASTCFLVALLVVMGLLLRLPVFVVLHFHILKENILPGHRTRHLLYLITYTNYSLVGSTSQPLFSLHPIYLPPSNLFLLFRLPPFGFPPATAIAPPPHPPSSSRAPAAATVEL
jgi:hypothetical protein